jgi:hypothetical protein
MRFDNSLPCDIPQMDLLSVPNTQSVVESGSWFLIPAEADFQTGSVIFKIQGDDCYIDLPETELLLTLSIRKIDNADDTKSTQIGGADRIGPVNDFISAIFSQIQVSINDVEVENSNESYPYRAYFENLLSYDKGSKTTFLQNGLFYKDEKKCKLSMIKTNRIMIQAKLKVKTQDTLKEEKYLLTENLSN